MRIQKVIMSCDDSHYKYYWPIVSKVCKKQLRATPVLFKIGEVETDFYFDGSGIVKEVKSIPEIPTGIQSLFYRMYGTKFFPEEVCLISDIDMMLLSYDYFQGTIKNFSEDSIVVYTSDAYDLERNDSKGLFDSNIYGMCYNAAKGKIFSEVLGLNGSFSDFVKRLDDFKYEKSLEWYGDEVFLTKKIEEYSEKFEVHRLKRGIEEGFKIKNRIEKWNFPVDYVNEQMRIDNIRDGNYDELLLENGYYLDCHCIRPYGFYEKEIHHVADIVCKKENLFQTIDGQDYSTVNDRCLIHDGDVVDVGCLNWDWSEFFIGKKRIIGVDPFENQVPHTEIFKGVLSDYDGKTKMKNEGISSSMVGTNEGQDVNVKTWKTFCDEFSINRISLLKINIEGAEYKLLDSFDDEDFEKIDQIAISFHDWMIPEWKDKTEKALNLLKSKNYEILKINDSWGWYLASKNEPKKFRIINYDEEKKLVYFGYSGDEDLKVSVRLSWNNLTIHFSEMVVGCDKNIIYYIGSNDLDSAHIDNFDICFFYQGLFEKYNLKKKNQCEFLQEEISFHSRLDDVSFHPFKEIFFEKVYEDDLVKIVSNDIVVDIGANYGFFGMYAKKCNPSKIICIEPSRKTFEYINKNIREAEGVQKAISGFGGISKFIDNEFSSNSSKMSDEKSLGYDVEVIGINELFNYLKIEKIDFLKIDCEGCEKEIFENISHESFEKINKMVIEYHSDEIKNIIIEKLKTNGFSIKKITNNIIFTYNQNLNNRGKKVALISTFCNNENKQNILKENILKLKNLGIDVIGISPIQIPQEIVNLCDYFFFTKDNPLLSWPIRMYTHWFEQPISEGRITTLQRGLPDYGWAGLYQVKKLSEIALTFDYEIFYHMIYDLEIDDVVTKELTNFNTNVIHPRRDPHHPEILWETTLHFMCFDRNMMKKICEEIKLEEYLRTNGVAEGEVLKWKNKFDIPTSTHPVKDKIFYWEDFDFFDYSPFKEFKFFPSKNERHTIWLGENPVYSEELTDKLRLVFHGFENSLELRIIINGKTFDLYPKPWEIIELEILSQEIETFLFEFQDKKYDFSREYRQIMMNQVYYNHRP